MGFPTDMVEDDPVLEQSEFNIRKLVVLGCRSGDSFKGTYEIVGRVANKTTGVPFPWISFLDWTVEI